MPFDAVLELIGLWAIMLAVFAAFWAVWRHLQNQKQMLVAQNATNERLTQQQTALNEAVQELRGIKSKSYGIDGALDDIRVLQVASLLAAMGKVVPGGLLGEVSCYEDYLSPDDESE